MQQIFGKSGRPAEFKFVHFISPRSCNGFDCSVSEYSEYLINDALRSQDDHIAFTWLLTERSTERTAAYMSLIMDAIKLSGAEKELHHLNYPFRTIPAMKIAKLADDRAFSEKYKGIGTFMIDTAERLAVACNTHYCASRFLTVDADIEHDKGTLAFYEKTALFPMLNYITKTARRLV